MLSHFAIPYQVIFFCDPWWLFSITRSQFTFVLLPYGKSAARKWFGEERRQEYTLSIRWRFISCV